MGSDSPAPILTNKTKNMKVEFEGKEYVFENVKTCSINKEGIYINGALVVRSSSTNSK